jgi:anaphase-promoting complex subunit 1
MNSANRLMTEIFLNRIGKKLQAEKNSNKMNYFSVCLGITIGLINLGMGKTNISGDLNLEEKLIKFINGGKKYDKVNSFQFDSDKGSSLIENEEININLTAPAAFIALGFIFLQTRNKVVANKIDFPKNLYELESKKPFQIYFAILTKNLILWDNIRPEKEFIFSQVKLINNKDPRLHPIFV